MKNKILLTLLGILSSSGFVHAEDSIDVTGTVRANYSYKDYSESSKDKLGDFDFDMLAIKFNGEVAGIGLSSEYRFYNGYDMIRYAYGFYDFNPNLKVKLGLVKKPFGNPGYISNSFWFGIPYYVGYEDDSDMGIAFDYSNGAWSSAVAFYKNAERGAGSNERYSTDIYSGVVNGIQYNNEETNQINLRQMYQADFEGGQAKIGASVEVGQIYNTSTGNDGDRYAVALHADISYNDWNLQLQAMQYEYDAADPEVGAENKIAVSAFQWQYEIAAKAQIYSINVAKSFSTSWGSVKVYNDFGLLTPDTEDSSFDDSLQNVTGVAIAAGATYTMIDFIAGENMYASGINDHVGLEQVDSGWDNRININFGYYF